MKPSVWGPMVSPIAWLCTCHKNTLKDRLSAKIFFPKQTTTYLFRFISIGLHPKLNQSFFPEGNEHNLKWMCLIVMLIVTVCKLFTMSQVLC